ncbi:hypothetical protein WMY93_008547 [Mugilogobius chulae]|uniref:Sterile alpha motif domain containing 3 n=1 Tax=Mugilogobius chulae TaxID=88201 RepID=A0AAW0PJC7_9GOBI
MLLRIILGDDNIRKVTLDPLPDTVEGLMTCLKIKLGISGEMVIQYQDPEFNMELCNLSNMTDLPKDKATLKVLTKATEPDHTDSSTLDSESMSSSCEDSPSTSQTRQLPHPFPIPTFAYDVELRLRSANEVFAKNGEVFETPKEMKSDLLDKLAEAIFVYTPYPTRDEIDAVAQALVEKHPCLKDPGSVFGWYSWKFSLKFKIQNFRQKLRQAGCPELSLNKRSSSPTKSKKLKKAKKSEVNFLPGHPEGKNENDLENERALLISEVKKRNIDWTLVDKMMDSTYSLRRKEIVKDEPLVAHVQERWPALFFVRQIELEFTRLTSMKLRESFLAGLDQYLDCFLELFKTKSGIPGLSSLLRQLDNSTHRKRIILLLGLPHFLKEDSSAFTKTIEVIDDEQSIAKGMKVGVLVVMDGQDFIDAAVVLEEAVVLSQLRDLPTAVAMLMGLLYSLNIDYPRELKYTFEVMQKVFMNIGDVSEHLMCDVLRQASIT